MNKAGLTQHLSRRFGFTHREAGIIVDKLLTTLAQELAQGRRVELRGLGTFGTRLRRPSLGRVVKTGQPVPIPSLRRVYFRPGRELKEIRPGAGGSPA
jgi:integration host factor subunit beta